MDLFLNPVFFTIMLAVLVLISIIVVVLFLFFIHKENKKFENQILYNFNTNSIFLKYKKNERIDVELKNISIVLHNQILNKVTLIIHDDKLKKNCEPIDKVVEEVVCDTKFLLQKCFPLFYKK